jgi:hypothetical protein
VNGSSFFVSMPNVPMISSFALVVVAVGPTLRAVLFPVAVLVLSRRLGPTIPVNSVALMARAAAAGCVTMIRSPATRGVPMMLEQTTVRTPVTREPSVTWTSTL